MYAMSRLYTHVSMYFIMRISDITMRPNDINTVSPYEYDIDESVYSTCFICRVDQGCHKTSHSVVSINSSLNSQYMCMSLNNNLLYPVPYTLGTFCDLFKLKMLLFSLHNTQSGGLMFTMLHCSPSVTCIVLNVTNILHIEYCMLTYTIVYDLQQLHIFIRITCISTRFVEYLKQIEEDV